MDVTGRTRRAHAGPTATLTPSAGRVGKCSGIWCRLDQGPDGGSAAAPLDRVAAHKPRGGSVPLSTSHAGQALAPACAPADPYDRQRGTRRRRAHAIGELARGTALSIKAIRRCEAAGLIYSAGEASCLPPVRRVGIVVRACDHGAALPRTLRSRRSSSSPACTTAACRTDRPQLAALLDRAEGRFDERLAELEAIRRRIGSYRAQHAEALAARPGADFVAADPRRCRVA